VAASLRSLHPSFRPFATQLILEAGQAGLQPRVTSTRRSRREQNFLYRRFLAGQSQYPVAPPGSSAHEYGLAFDVVVQPYGALSDLGNRWEELGGVWGGRFGDPIHFEPPGFSRPSARRAGTLQSSAELVASLFVPLPVTLLRTAQKRLFPEFTATTLRLAKKVLPDWWVDLADRLTSF